MLVVEGRKTPQTIMITKQQPAARQSYVPKRTLMHKFAVGDTVVFNGCIHSSKEKSVYDFEIEGIYGLIETQRHSDGTWRNVFRQSAEPTLMFHSINIDDVAVVVDLDPTITEDPKRPFWCENLKHKICVVLYGERLFFMRLDELAHANL